MFDYSAYDTVGNLVTTGMLTLSRTDSQVTGSWQFNDGQSGNLLGSMVGDNIWIDLNPGYVDNNLILRGRRSGRTYVGEWVKYGYAIIGRGTFVADMR